MLLLSQIQLQKRVLEIDGREWKFKVDQNWLERDRIKAIRDIG